MKIALDPYRHRPVPLIELPRFCGIMAQPPQALRLSRSHILALEVCREGGDRRVYARALGGACTSF
jgi:hypothetical protein